jgi:hypothetical protein
VAPPAGVGARGDALEARAARALRAHLGAARTMAAGLASRGGG